MTNPPRVSIVLPFRNSAQTLPACLRSVRKQTLRDFELIALDDRSEDGSAGIVRSFGCEPVKVEGFVTALNQGLALAHAPIVARMDADEIMHPDRLLRQVEFLEAHPEIAVCACRVRLFPREAIRAGYREYVRWQNALIAPEEIAANIYVESPFAHPSVMFRKTVVADCGGYRDGPFPEDYDLWMRLAQAGHAMARLPEVLLKWRERPDRASRTDPRYSRDAFDRLRAKYLAADPRLAAAREIVIWGAGRKTRQRAQLLIDHGIPVSAWIDIDPRKVGRIYGERPVHPPEFLQRAPRPFVLIYVTNHGARDLIAARLQELGYRPGVDFLAVG
jgi:GT2 family glycosyltransferase